MTHWSKPNIPGNYAKATDITAAIAAQATTDSGQYTATNTLAMDSKVHGVVGDGVTDDTAALNALFTAASTARVPVLLRGTFLISSTVTWPGEWVGLYGYAGSQATFKPNASNFDALVIGTSASTAGNNDGTQQTGFVRDIRINANGGSCPTGIGTTAGFVVNGMRHTTFERITVQGTPIGFDFRHNNYGCVFRDMHVPYGDAQVAMLLRGQVAGVYGSGNDLSFFNCWLSGRDAAVWAEQNGGGYHFFGGQLASGVGASSANDILGTLTINRLWADYASGTASPAYGTSAGMEFVGVSFENPQYRWAFRVLSPGLDVSFKDCSFNASGSNPGIGVAEIGSGTQNYGYNDRLTFEHCAVGGTWTQAASAMLVLRASNTDMTPMPLFYEHGTGGYATCNGVVTDFAASGLLARSGVTHGAVGFSREATTGRGILMLENAWLRTTIAGAVQYSPDQGITWTNFSASVFQAAQVNVLSVNESRAVTDVSRAQTVNASLAQDVTTYRVATAPSSYKVTATGTSAITLKGYSANVVTVAPGMVVTLSCYVQSSVASRQAKMTYNWYNSGTYVSATDGTYVNAPVGSGGAGGSWALVTNTATVPAGVNGIQWSVGGVTGTANDIMWVTEVTELIS
jgi:hypothetical protein